MADDFTKRSSRGKASIKNGPELRRVTWEVVWACQNVEGRYKGRPDLSDGIKFVHEGALVGLQGHREPAVATAEVHDQTTLPT